jgi:ferredoxin
MIARRPRWSAAWARRAVQVAALLLFLGLFLAVRMRPGWVPDWTVTLFFLLDPLILAATLLAAHAVPAAFLLALVTVVVTALLGRVFCGWFCPFGTLHAIAGRVLGWIRPARKTPQPFSPWQRTKYYVLAGFLVMAALGGHWVCAWDPIVLLTRSCAAALFPGAQWAVEDGSKAVFDADLRVGSLKASDVTDVPYVFLRDHVLGIPHLSFIGGGALLGILLVLLLLNGVRRRFWCRYLCPLGALLGLIAWRPALRRHVKKEACNACDLCGSACAGGAAAAPGDRWMPTECLVCLGCGAACRREGLGFDWSMPLTREPEVERLDLSKRALAASAVGGVIGLGLMRITPQARGSVFHPDLIRPPGSRAEREFLQRCLACGLCFKACPTGGLQPAWSEAGLEGLWTPRLVPAIGYCDFTCNLCGQVCPTEAIRPLPLDEKQKTRIGLARFDTTRCIPYAYGRECIVCEEHCPLPKKAIYAVETEVTLRDGTKVTLKQPRIDPELCTGCGNCEYVCPFKDRPAVRVYSANESRHPKTNQPILPSSGGGADPY